MTEESQNDEGSDQDDEAGNEKNGDNDSPPPPSPQSCAFNHCNWAQEVNCKLPKLEPLKSQKMSVIDLVITCVNLNGSKEKGMIIL